MADLTPIIAALLGGGYKGYRDQEESNRQNELMQMKKAAAEADKNKLISDSAKTEAEMLGKGLKLDPLTKKYAPYPEFYTPKNAITPQQSEAFDQSQMAAQVAGTMAPGMANPYHPISSARAAAAMSLAPEGDPNDLRLKHLAEIEKMSKGNSSVGVTNLDLSQYASDPIVKKYGFTPEQLKNIPANHPLVDTMKYQNRPQTPGNAPATPDQVSDIEKTLGPGMGANLTSGQYQAFKRYIEGQKKAGERQGVAIASATERQNKSLGQSAGQFGERLDFDKQKDLESRLEKFRDDYKKTGIPENIALIERLDKSTGILSKEKPDLSKIPGYGTNAVRSLPLIGQGASTLMAKSYGGEEQAQILQTLLNADIRQLSGQAVTKYEEGRNLAARGMGLGGNEKDVARGIKLMHEGLLAADRDVRAAYSPEVLSLYEKRGGKPALNPSQQRAEKANERTQGRAAGDQSGSAKKLNIAPNILEAISDPTQIAKKEYNKELDRTRITLKNGKKMVVSGDQR